MQQEIYIGDMSHLIEVESVIESEYSIFRHDTN